MKNNQTAFLKLCLADALIKRMERQPYETVNVNAICEEAGVGRTTFYRHFGNKGSKEELLAFKVSYEWTRYADSHAEDVKKDRTGAFLHYIYENKRLFSLIYASGLLSVLTRIFETFVAENYPPDRGGTYLTMFFAYGTYGVVCQWIRYGFDETPEELWGHMLETALAGWKQPS